jgi:uncharacterized protein (DUF2141 family)
MRLGMTPMEPLAFSNNAKLGMFGPPKYADAKFVLPSEGITLDMACKK